MRLVKFTLDRCMEVGIGVKPLGKLIRHECKLLIRGDREDTDDPLYSPFNSTVFYVQNVYNVEKKKAEARDNIQWEAN